VTTIRFSLPLLAICFSVHRGVIFHDRGRYG
jgi:hypothetical protein